MGGGAGWWGWASAVEGKRGGLECSDGRSISLPAIALMTEETAWLG